MPAASSSDSRITPERAGNTPHQIQHTNTARDHPRARGEYDRLDRCQQLHHGSPPSARGIQCLLPCPRPPSGITPERAGNTVGCMALIPPRWDHPRARGEYLHSPVTRTPENGSPQSARGIRNDRTNRKLDIGITPERAGNTHNQTAPRRHGSDHPRARGEYMKASGGPPTKSGSPPSARGIPRPVVRPG